MTDNDPLPESGPPPGRFAPGRGSRGPMIRRCRDPAQVGAERERLHRATAIMRQGQAEESKGLYAQAEASFRDALAIDPLDGIARLELAKVCERQGKVMEALLAYQDVVYLRGGGMSTVSTDFTCRLRYILFLARHEMRWQEVAFFYAGATAGTKYSPDGAALAGRFDAQRIDFAGMQAAAHYLLGVHKPTFGQADPEEQREHLQEAVALRPDWALARLAYGRSLEKAKQLREAREEYVKAASLDKGGVGVEAEEAIEKLNGLEQFLRRSNAEPS